jgi:excinuclease ABC subunit A
LTVVCGVSGSGKSTLLEEVLAPSLRSVRARGAPVECESVSGAELVAEVVLVDQGPVGRTPRANVLSYTKAFDVVRARFAATDAARRLGLEARAFSLNTPGGRCERCSGDGHERIDMQFLAPVFVRCDECEGRRFRDEVLSVTDRGKSIGDVLALSVSDARAFYADAPHVARALEPLVDVGLGYVRLGQPLNTLSGGEAQRLKLAFHLGRVKQGAKPLLLLLDEPTAGLHLADVKTLLGALDRLARAGHAVVVVEHHLDVIAAADHVIELGPGGGPSGGEKVYEGTVAGLLTSEESPTGEALRGRSRPRRRVSGTGSGSGSGSGVNPEAILVQGAHEHNLRGVSVDIPRRKVTAITGLSGSGKSTLAFDVLFREGQRRYLDTLSPYARQFVARGERPNVDAVLGVPPSVAIEQRTSRYGRLSTVATVVELHPYLRVLYANAGIAHCPKCRVAIEPETEDALAKRLARSFGGSRSGVFAPLVRSRKGHHRPVFERVLRKLKKRYCLVDGALVDLEEGIPSLERFREHDVLVRVDDETRALPRETSEARALVREALALGEGTFLVRAPDESWAWLSAARTCPECGRGFEPLDVRLFTWTSRRGRCERCWGSGLEGWNVAEDDGARVSEGEEDEGELDESDWEACRACGGARLNELARAVTVAGLSLNELCARSVDELATWSERLESRAGPLRDARAREVARPVLRALAKRLAFLRDVGLGYLSLDRGADTLSGGEAQRLRLAAQLGAGLTGVLYVLDEPTIGLHARDATKLVRALHTLRDGGNTVIVVEHDERVIRSADHVIDLGPGAGRDGGRVVARGTPAEIAANDHSLTGRCLAGKEPSAASLARRRPLDGDAVVVRGARARNLRGIDFRVPLGTLVAVSGVSGSGKSTLVRDVLLKALARVLHKARVTPGKHDALEGAALVARGSRGRPEPDRADAALGARDLHGDLHSLEDALRVDARGARARLRGRSLLLQRPLGPLRRVRRTGARPRRDGLPPDRRGPVRGVPGRALRRGDARRALERAVDRGRARAHGPRGARGVRERAAPEESPRAHGRARARLPDARPALDAPLGRRGPAREARPRALEESARAHPLRPRRADDRPPLGGRGATREGAPESRRPRRHGRRHRAQPRRDRGVRPRLRPGTRRRRARWGGRRLREAGRDRPAPRTLGHGALARPDPARPGRGVDYDSRTSPSSGGRSSNARIPSSASRGRSRSEMSPIRFRSGTIREKSIWR